MIQGNVYISLGRLFTREDLDKRLERVLGQEEVIKFERKHPVISATMDILLGVRKTAQYLCSRKYRNMRTTYPPCE